MEKYSTYITAQLHMAAHQEALLKDDARQPEMSSTEWAIRLMSMSHHFNLALHAADLSE